MTVKLVFVYICIIYACSHWCEHTCVQKPKNIVSVSLIALLLSSEKKKVAY